MWFKVEYLDFFFGNMNIKWIYLGREVFRVELINGRILSIILGDVVFEV